MSAAPGLGDASAPLDQLSEEAAAAAAAEPTRDPKPKPHPQGAARKRARKREPSGAEKARKRRERDSGKPASAPADETPPSPAQIKSLERGLARTLTMPAIPTLMLPLPVDSKMFMLTHFITAGPATAKQLAAAAEGSPELRELLERANKGSAFLTLLMAGCIYLAPIGLWMTGQREAAAMASAMASMDPAELEARAEQMQAEMEAQMQAAMMAANGGQGAQQQGAQGPEHEGLSDPAAPPEPAQAS